MTILDTLTSHQDRIIDRQTIWCNERRIEMAIEVLTKCKEGEMR